MTKTFKIRDYRRLDNGKFVLTFGSKGEPIRFAPREYDTEEEVKKQLASWEEENQQADEDERRFNVQ